MSFLDKIEDLQKKPEAHRRKVLTVLMIVIMSAVFVIWIYSFRISIGALDKQKEKSSVENYAPLEMIKDAFGDIKSKIEF